MGEKRICTAKTVTNPLLYRDLYKFYYKERYKTAITVCTVIGVIALIIGMWFMYNAVSKVPATIGLWIGIVLIGYPRFMYRRPFKDARDHKEEFRFNFFDTYYEEKNNAGKVEIAYKEIYKIYEKGYYFYIFRDKDTVSVLDKRDITAGSEDEVRARLTSGGAPYKKVK